MFLTFSVGFVLLASRDVNAFSSVLFQETPKLQRTAPSKADGIDIELPDFDELFGRIQLVSPLARNIIQDDNNSKDVQQKGFQAIHDKADSLKWKTLESNPRNTVHKIEKIDNFDGKSCPIFRVRASLEGPCVGEAFAQFIMDYEERKKWDIQIDHVSEAYPIYDLDYANIAMGFGKYGDCVRLGVGYCRTKANLGISPREQLTICGLQDFHETQSCLMWGVEMEEWHNHLFPKEYERTTRAKSHIFSIALTPTSENSFDVEYILQLDVGGKLPTWLTTPIILDSVKRMFNTAESYFKGTNGELQQFLDNKSKEDELANRHGILMTF